MVDPASAPAPTTCPRSFAIWCNALAGLGFVAMMVLPLEAAAAWCAGAALHSTAVAWVVAAALVLPTMWLIGGHGLRNALQAEMDLAASVRPHTPQS